MSSAAAPQNPTEIILVRHGQTDWNAAGLLQGSTDIPLNDTGRAQARSTAADLAEVPFDVVVSSPLGRARETAEVIAAAAGRPVREVVPGLIERGYGEAEGITQADADARWSTRPYPGEEPDGEIEARGLAALHALAAEFPGGTVLAVAHGTIIRILLTAIAGFPVTHIANAAINRIRITPDGAGQVVTINGVDLSPATQPELTLTH